MVEEIHEEVKIEAPDIKSIYQNTFPFVAAWIARMGGNADVARDIFHDALIIFYEKTMGGNNETLDSAPAYILGISKHLWLKKFSSSLREVDLNSFEATLSIPDGFYPNEETISVLSVVERVGKKCLDLLTAFYYDKLSHLDIAKRFGFSNERSATVQKFKCIEKVRSFVKIKNLNPDDFKA